MKILITLLLVFCFAAIGLAQERIIQKAEFDSVMTEGGKHQLKWKGEKYRMTVTTTSKALNRPQTDWASRMIFEYGPANEYHSVTTSAFGGKATPAKEFIKVGSSSYARSGDGSWGRIVDSPASAGQTEKPETPTRVLTNEVEYRHLGAGSINDKPVQIYLKSERKTYETEKGEKFESDVKTRYWIGADGLFLKSELASENRGTAVTSRNLITTEWELDPTIKFTAPEVVQ
ncbi:MAG TPA: hypothetical protein VMZ26_06075 [Pyrinomonadaceae bacterium]|nr:hypothetical protein [Pyrinomonadaceae bacterium]